MNSAVSAVVQLAGFQEFSCNKTAGDTGSWTETGAVVSNSRIILSSGLQKGRDTLEGAQTSSGPIWRLMKVVITLSYK